MSTRSYSKLEAGSSTSKVVRPEVVRQIEEARAHGDLSENAEATLEDRWND